MQKCSGLDCHSCQLNGVEVEFMNETTFCTQYSHTLTIKKGTVFTHMSKNNKIK